MSLQIHLGIKDDELLLQTLLVRADEMVLSEVNLESIVVDIVLRLSTTIAAVAQVAALVAVTTMGEEFIVSVEALTTEATLRMALEARLVLGTRDIITVLFVSTQLLRGKQFVFMSEDLLVTSTQITHLFMVDTLDVTMQVGPS